LRLIVGIGVERAALSVFGILGFPPHTHIANEVRGIVTPFLRWDAAIYQRIAVHGYSPAYKDDPAFYPLYPLTVRFVSKLGFLSVPRAALFVSWVSLFFACWGVIALTEVIFPGSKAWRAGALLAFFPASVFLLAGYAESMYAALAAWALVAVAVRRVWIGAVLASLASVTRAEGITLSIGVFAWVVIDGWRPGQLDDLAASLRLLGRAVLLGVTSLAAFLVYTVFVWQRYGNPFQEIWAQRFWQRKDTWPFHAVFWSFGEMLTGKLRGSTAANTTAKYLLDDFALIFAVVCVVAFFALTWRRRALWWVILPALASLLLIASNSPQGRVPEADARLVMCMVPFYAVVARVRSEAGWSALLAGSAMFAAIFQMIFNTAGWLT
jgi:hypothetical protein